MKTCKACGELNGDTRTSCCNCGGSLGKAEGGYQKICLKCNSIYSSSATICDACHIPLAVHAPKSGQSTGSSVDSTDGVSRALAAVGNILLFASVVAAITGFIVSGNAFAYQVQERLSSPRMAFHFWAALAGGFGSLFTVLVPGLVLCGLSRLIDYAQQTSEHSKALFNRKD